MRICIDARIGRSGLYGGIEQFVIGLASGLSDIATPEDEFIFLCYPGCDAWLRPFLRNGCQILYTSSPAPSDSASKAFIRKTTPWAMDAWYRLPWSWYIHPFRPALSDGTIERAAVDVMHFTTQSAFLTRVPSIYHPHDLQHLHLPQYFSRRTRAAREYSYRLFCNRAEIVSVNSEWTRSDIIKHYGLAPSAVRVVELASPTEAYDSVKADANAVCCRLKVPQDFALYPAQTWPHKYHIMLLRAIAKLRDEDLLVVPLVCCGGRTSHFKSINTEIHKLGLHNQVVFPGFVSPGELRCLYDLCRCVVIPTKFEAGSFPLWEAFHSGRAAACSDVTSLPEQAGGAALLFNPDCVDQICDCLRRLWLDEKLRNELVQRGLKQVQRTSWARTASEFRKIYLEITRNRQAAPLALAD